MSPLRRSTRVTKAPSNPYTIPTAKTSKVTKVTKATRTPKPAKVAKAAKSTKAIKNRKATRNIKNTKVMKATKATKVTKTTKATKATRKRPQKTTKTSRATNWPVALLPNPADPIDRLPDLCLDILFSYFPITKLIGIRSVNKLWRDTVDWRLGNLTFQKRHCPELSIHVNKGAWQKRGELAECFRKEVYRHEMRTRETPTFIRKFTGIVEHKYWDYNCWEVCGDFFVWFDSHAVNIRRVFNLGRNENNQTRRYPLEKFLKFSIFTGDQLAIRPIGICAGSGKNPALIMMAYKFTEQWGWDWTGRISTIDVVTGKLLWYRDRQMNHHIYMGETIHNHCTPTISWVQYRGYQLHRPTGTGESYTVDVFTGKPESPPQKHEVEEHKIAHKKLTENHNLKFGKDAEKWADSFPGMRAKVMNERYYVLSGDHRAFLISFEPVW